VLLSGFGLVTAGFATLGLKGLTADGKLDWRKAQWGIWLAVAGIAAWAIGLWRA